jgi:hypothetical protein
VRLGASMRSRLELVKASSQSPYGCVCVCVHRQPRQFDIGYLIRSLMLPYLLLTDATPWPQPSLKRRAKFRRLSMQQDPPRCILLLENSGCNAY